MKENAQTHKKKATNKHYQHLFTCFFFFAAVNLYIAFFRFHSCFCPMDIEIKFISGLYIHGTWIGTYINKLLGGCTVYGLGMWMGDSG